MDIVKEAEKLYKKLKKDRIVYVIDADVGGILKAWLGAPDKDGEGFCIYINDEECPQIYGVDGVYFTEDGGIYGASYISITSEFRYATEEEIEEFESRIVLKEMM